MLIKQIRLRDLLNNNFTRTNLDGTAVNSNNNDNNSNAINDDADFNDKYEVHTLTDVIKEIRDDQVIIIDNANYNIIIGS